MEPSNDIRIQDDGDSFDELDNSLDRALRNASNNLFKYSDSRTASRNSSNGSSGGIILSNMQPAVDEGYEIDRQLSNDSALLMPERNYQGHRRSLSTTEATNAIVRSSKRLLERYIPSLGKTKRYGSTERLRLTRTLSAGEDDAHIDTSNTDQRYVSPRNQISSSQNTYPSNAVSNARYNPITFVPVILYEQFKFFFNLYFLLVALSQIVPQLRIGYLSSYIVPLGFVLTVTMMKEAGDDLQRRRRDKEQNSELYEVLNRFSSISEDPISVASKDLKVGDIVKLHKDARIPADMVLLQTSDKDDSGEAFIKTDQLDGETDWKLRRACSLTQKMTSTHQLVNLISLIVSAPEKSIHRFNGKLIYHPHNHIGAVSTSNNESYPLGVDQTVWANTVLASNTAIGMIIYTGIETRQSLNSSKSGVKTGLLELEINKLSKILCVVVFLLSITLVLANGFPLKSSWYIDILRFLILFSSIIPVSLRVNLDLAKSVYASQIQKDHEIKDTIVRTSTIPEDLGRIEYLLSDKTGTLTQNDMELKKLHLGPVSYAGDTLDIVSDYVKDMWSLVDGLKKRDLSTKLCDLVLTLSLCHNVTPTYDDENDLSKVSYQAASPDEIAIVKFVESVGLMLYKRDRKSIHLLHAATNQIMEFEILYVFPFNSDTKRMGIIVKDVNKEEIWFMQKGADTVMSRIVGQNDWLDEETSNMAREGLRTLVIGRKNLSDSLYSEFVKEFDNASLALQDRENKVQKVIRHYLEKDLELLGLTGVEDKLQKDVKTSIELLRNAGIKIWMLTGDKVETAKCVSISARLISRGQYVHQITKVTHPELALNQLESIRNNKNACLLIDGESLDIYMKYFKDEFFAIAIGLPAVIACRCTPQQKADIAIAIKERTGRRVCCIGDGGNDVSMIQSADVGVGIVGKEGKQASLAADFSINQFCYLSKLLLWHGRNSYKRSAKLGQFIIHRGLLISVAQAVYSISSLFEPLALYQGWLMVGYSTVYTMAPVFSLTLDCDIDEHLTRLYPELYRDLTLGKSLSYKTFFMWVLISLYQGSVIQLMSQKFQTLDVENFTSMVTLSFSILIYNELMMVCLSINKWKKVMASTLIITFLIYLTSIPFLAEYFDLDYVTSFTYIWQTVVVLAVSLFPVWLSQFVNRKLRPPSYAKVQQD